jgi:hypothetical protein
MFCGILLLKESGNWKRLRVFEIFLWNSCQVLTLFSKPGNEKVSEWTVFWKVLGIQLMLTSPAIACHVPSPRGDVYVGRAPRSDYSCEVTVCPWCCS